jgi:hypothetical protein
MRDCFCRCSGARTPDIEAASIGLVENLPCTLNHGDGGNRGLSGTGQGLRAAGIADHHLLIIELR